MFQIIEEKARMIPSRIILLDRMSALEELRIFLGSKVVSSLKKSTIALWARQAKVVTSAEAEEALRTGRISSKVINSWRQENSSFVKTDVMRTYLLSIGVAGSRMAGKINDSKKQEGFDLVSTTGSIQDWTEEHGGKLITDLNSSQATMISAVLSQYVIIESIGPYALAQRIKPLIGLTDRFALAVGRKLTAMLEAGADLARAMAEAERYALMLQDLRAENISRWELSNAYNFGQMESLSQAREQGYVSGIEKTWETADDERVCDECDGMDGETVGIDENFSNGDNAPPAHGSCRCSMSYSAMRSEE